MTEEITIDGVNVAKCEYYYEMDDCDGCHQLCDNATDIKNEYCEHYKDCHYKQLKRLEQVNKELIEDNLSLSKENKELKEKVKVLDKMTGIFSARLCNNYRSALEEIRKILTDEYYIDTLKAIHKIDEVLTP